MTLNLILEEQYELVYECNKKVIKYQSLFRLMFVDNGLMRLADEPVMCFGA